MTSREFRSKPYQNVHWLIEQINQIFLEQVIPKGGPDPYTKAADVMVKLRNWEPSRRFYSDHIVDVLRELNILYVPKVLEPGPALLFPLLDVRNRYTLGRLKPLYDFQLNDQTPKYLFLGNTADTIGPNWLGMTDRVIKRILETRMVVLVEGFFDVIASRLLAPDVPVISTGTKKFSDMHIANLLMFGVKNLWLMFDSEEAKADRTKGAGEIAAEILQKKWNKELMGRRTPMEIRRYNPPSTDPAACLKEYDWARSLRRQLLEMR